MPNDRPVVTVVLDRSFGDRLGSEPVSLPAWVVDSESNQRLARQVGRDRPATSHLDGITTFTAGSDDTAEKMLLAQIGPIDLHHGPYSSDPPYGAIACIGTAATPAIKVALEEIGFGDVRPSPHGFTARRLHKHQVSD